MSMTVQGHQIPSSSTVSALKLTVCGSAIVFSVNVGSARAIETGLGQQRRKLSVRCLYIPLLGYKVVSSVLR